MVVNEGTGYDGGDGAGKGMTMNQDPTTELDDFVAEAVRRTLFIQQAAGKDIARLSAEFSAYMTENVQAFMEKGVSVMDVQNRIRSALEATVSSEPVPGPAVNDRPRNSEVLEGEINSRICFIPLAERAVADLSDGVTDQDAFIEALSASSEDIAVIEMSDGLTFVLTDFGKSPAFDEVADGGEIVTDSTNEA